jgi:DNA-binding transcriptional LysR family regulator
MNPLKTIQQAKWMITFARIIETGGISSAASAMGVDKASVSRQLQDFEHHMGVRLLNRNTRGISLTDVGDIVGQRATNVLNEVEKSYVEAEHFQASPSGVLTISTSVAFGKMHVVPYLNEFREKFPLVDLELCLLDRHVDIVEEGFDLLLRLCDNPPQQLVAHRLGDIKYALVASPKYLKQVGNIRNISQLSELDCLFYGYKNRVSNWIFYKDLENYQIPVRSRFSINSSEAIRQVCLDGGGVALLPCFVVAEDIQKKQLEILFSEFEPRGGLGNGAFALHLPGRYVAPKTRAFIEHIKQTWLASNLWSNCSK